MATSANVFNPRLAEKKLYLAAAVTFPLVFLAGYF
jgi:hypothetical protein